jgi:transcriptional regulator with XRE-family HTH domain
MFDTILTAEQAKRARGALGLSQGRVASAVDLNRTYLSQFENGRYVLPDSVLHRLGTIARDRGTPSSGSTCPQRRLAVGLERGDSLNHDRPRARVMDGFVVPEQVDDSEADALLTEYAENVAKIRALWSSPLKKGFFGGVDVEDRDRREGAVVALMARNYALVEQLHGHEAVDPGEKQEMETLGYCVAQAFTEVRG